MTYILNIFYIWFIILKNREMKLKQEILELKEQIKSLRAIIITNNKQYMRLKSEYETLEIAFRSLLQKK